MCGVKLQDRIPGKGLRERLGLHTQNHFTSLCTLSGTTRMSRYQKVHFAIFWIFWSKMKITQADAPTVWMDCHPIQTNWCPHLCYPHHFMQDALTYTTLPIYPGLGQAPNMLACIPGGFIKHFNYLIFSFTYHNHCHDKVILNYLDMPSMTITNSNGLNVFLRTFPVAINCSYYCFCTVYIVMTANTCHSLTLNSHCSSSFTHSRRKPLGNSGIDILPTWCCCCCHYLINTILPVRAVVLLHHYVHGSQHSSESFSIVSEFVQSVFALGLGDITTCSQEINWVMHWYWDQ